MLTVSMKSCSDVNHLFNSVGPIWCSLHDVIQTLVPSRHELDGARRSWALGVLLALGLVPVAAVLVLRRQRRVFHRRQLPVSAAAF